MYFRNVAGQGVYVYAHDKAADAPKTGDAANITATISKDGAAAGALATAHPTEIGGGIYWYPLSQAETDANAFAVCASSGTAGVQIDPVVVSTQAGAIPAVSAGQANGLRIEDGKPIPAVPVYAFEAPVGIVIVGPQWNGAFDVVGVYNGRPSYKRRDSSGTGSDFYLAWNGVETWNLGRTLGGSETGYSHATPSPLGEWTPPADIVVDPVTNLRIVETSGGALSAGQQVTVTVHAYKTVPGESIVYDGVGRSANITIGSNDAAVQISWDALAGAAGYAIHVAGLPSLDIYTDISEVSVLVLGDEGADSSAPDLLPVSPYSYAPMQATALSLSADTLTIQGEAAGTAIQIGAAAAITAQDLATAAQVNAITTNTTRGRPIVPDQFGRPAIGGAPITYEIDLNLYTLQGGMETPTTAPTVHARNPAGTGRDNLLGSTAMVCIAAGRYKAAVTVLDSTAAEQVLFDFTWTVGTETFAASDSVWITDAYAVDFTSADRAKLAAIHGVLPADDARIGTSNYSGGAANFERRGDGHCQRGPGNPRRRRGDQGERRCSGPARRRYDSSGQDRVRAGAGRTADPCACGLWRRDRRDHLEPFATDAYRRTIARPVQRLRQRPGHLLYGLQERHQAALCPGSTGVWRRCCAFRHRGGDLFDLPARRRGRRRPARRRRP